MAILRGGRRIGNFDIRLGLPRGSEYDDIAGDIKSRSGANHDAVINRFTAQINQGEGMARPTRYLVKFFYPQGWKAADEILYEPMGAGGYGQGGVKENKKRLNNLAGGTELMRNVGMMCNKISMPSRDINTVDHLTYGPRRQMPYGVSFPGTIEATFYADKYLRQRMFFEKWQSLIYGDPLDYNMNYYTDYIGKVHIYQIGGADEEGNRDRITYAVELDEVYPQTIGEYSLAYDAVNQIVEVPVTLNYRTWRNLSIGEVYNTSVGQSYGEMPVVKPGNDFGVFGGILSKLPPEFRRVGRDVIGQIKRSTPIGRVTGGRVFPPFL